MKKLVYFLALVIILAFKSENSKIKIFMIGDSTMANKNRSDAPETGWGQVFSNYFNNAISIQNHAVNGQSTKSFRSKGYWKKVSDQLEKGDYVFIQFGHNDQKNNDTSRYADPTVEFSANLSKYIDEIEAKGAFPILLSPVVRRSFDVDSKLIDTHGAYPESVKNLAMKRGLSYIDLNKLSQELLINMGNEGSKRLFLHLSKNTYDKYPEGVEDNTHFSFFGANKIAVLVIEELMKQSHPLKAYLKKSVYPTKFEYELPLVYQPVFKKDTFNILKYGAKADGISLKSDAINSALKFANLSGGGTVLIPKGTWLTGPIELKSNVNLHLEKGAVLQFTEDKDQYPLILTTWEGQKAYRCQAPLSGTNLINIGLTGEGIIDGAGDVWKAVKKSKLTDSQWQKYVNSGGVLNAKGDMWYPSQQSKLGNEDAKLWASKIVEGKTLADYKLVRDFLRPNMLSLTQCENILIEGLTFQNSPAWTLHPLLCKYLTMRDLNVKNPWYGQNNDALDIESCQIGILDNCTFDTGDDAITIKSGRDEEGRKRGVPTSDFIIKNTTVFHGHGGFVIGSEMSGGVNNLFVNNCNFLGTDIGLRFKTARGRGGVVEKIFISDINMNSIPAEAILFDMYYAALDPISLKGEKEYIPQIELKPVNEGTPIFRNFVISNVVCSGAETALMIRGLPEMNISDITIENSTIISNNGIKCQEAQNIKLNNLNILNKSKHFAQISNSSNIQFNTIKGNSNKIIQLSGSKTNNIRVVNANSLNPEFEFLDDLKKSILKTK
jgi:DNA sulfur modification protein DndE